MQNCIQLLINEEASESVQCAYSTENRLLCIDLSLMLPIRSLNMAHFCLEERVGWPLITRAAPTETLLIRCLAGLDSWNAICLSCVVGKSVKNINLPFLAVVVNRDDKNKFYFYLFSKNKHKLPT